MTDEIKPTEVGNADGAEATKQHTPEETQALIKQLREEAKAHRLEASDAKTKLAELKTQQEAAATAALAEQGKFKDLYEKTAADLAKIKADADEKAAYATAFQASVEKRIADIPEGMRSLVPEGLTPLKLSEWLDKNAALLTSRQAPNFNPGAGGASGGKPVILTAEQVAMAKAFNMTPEQYAKQLQAQGRE